ncbi:12419_t:CDS:1, partial [Dentiscutata erythropus]
MEVEENIQTVFKNKSEAQLLSSKKHKKHKAIYKEEQILNQLEDYKDASVLSTGIAKRLVE